MKVNPPIAAAAQILKPHVAKGATGASPWRGFLHQSANHIAAWADQAVVSGTSFLTLIMIGLGGALSYYLGRDAGMLALRGDKVTSA